LKSIEYVSTVFSVIGLFNLFHHLKMQQHYAVKVAGGKTFVHV